MPLLALLLFLLPDIGRTITTPIAHDGLIYAADQNGLVHCLDAKTDRRVWVHGTRAPVNIATDEMLYAIRRE